MHYSVNLDFFTKKLKMSFEDSVKLIAKLGFDALDYTSLSLSDPDCVKKAVQELGFIEKKRSIRYTDTRSI